ncbi:GDP-mannose-dependent alpha-mannosyltransferase [Carnimonas sp. R-84981]|uniref:glycosyltransferase family 4 protein n=1 Tax=Carnimonas bestiolae TaxID=3402172 RepID=UPI003EDB8D1E
MSLRRGDTQPSAVADAAPAVRKVCFVSETWHPEINGVTHTLSHLVDHLHQRGYPLQLVRPTPDEGGTDPRMDEELQVRALPVLDYDGVHMGGVMPARLKAFWQAQRPDVLYIATEGPLGMVAVRVARQLGIPMVSGFHTNFDFYSQHYILLRVVRPFVRSFLRRFHNKTAITLVPTRAQADLMADQGFKRVEVMGRGLDTASFSPEFRSPELREEWCAGSDQRVALHVGRLAAEKNVGLLIETLEALRAANPRQIAVIVGDGPLRAEMEKRLPWAHFAGFQRGEALARYYASADMFLFPSRSETYGNVVIEAMASGLATVAFDYAAASELIRDGHNGVTITLDNNADFIEKSKQLAADPAAVRLQGEKARERVLELSWEKIGVLFTHYLHEAQEVKDA